MDYNTFDREEQATYEALKSNSVVMEALTEMSDAQEGRDKIGYVNAALESMSKKETQVNIARKLFTYLEKADQIDFGRIPDSKGNLTNYVYYDQLYDMIELLNKIMDGKPTKNMEILIKLHQSMLNLRSDFQWGFRTQNYTLINIYNVGVMMLFEMVSICVVDATTYLRKKVNMDVTPMPQDVRNIARAAGAFVRAIEDGTWNRMMKMFRTEGGSGSDANGFDNIFSTVAASESAALEADYAEFMNDRPAGFIQTMLKDKLKSPKTMWKDAHMPGKVAIVIIACIGLFMAIRWAVSYFVNAASSLREKLRNNATILRAAMAAENNPNMSAIDKQKFLLEKMEATADVVEYKILKTERASNTEMKKENREDFSRQELAQVSGSDFEF